MYANITFLDSLKIQYFTVDHRQSKLNPVALLHIF